MTSITVYLQENLPRLNQDKRCHVAPNISSKLLNNAIKGFSYTGNPNLVIGIMDTTLLKNAKDGMLFTAQSMIFKPMFQDPIVIDYANIKCTEFTVDEKKNRSLLITKNNDVVTKIELVSECDLEVLSEILNSCSKDFTEYKEENLMVSIDEMSETLKAAYTKVIINMAFENHGAVDEKELAEMLLLMTRLNLTTETRLELRRYLSSSDNQISTEQLIQIIENECEPSQIKVIHISLVKDLVNLHFCTVGEDLENFTFLKNNRDKFKISDEQLELVVMAIKNDRKMLSEEMTDDQFTAAMKTLGAKAAAVGTPIAAVYLSGSVVGLSAAGMTSGLATLGMGGLLGLSSMATGIGVVVLIGVGTYAGIKKFTGANELDGSKRRELMLKEVLKQTQRTISLLMTDINYISKKLNEALVNHADMTEQLKKYAQVLTQLTSAGTVLSGKASEAQKSSTKTRCARFLDIDKLQSLTREPTHKDTYDFVVACYEERQFNDTKKEPPVEMTKLVVKKDIAQEDLDKLSQVFEAIGYFNATEVIAGAAVDMANKAKNKLTGLFS